LAGRSADALLAVTIEGEPNGKCAYESDLPCLRAKGGCELRRIGLRCRDLPPVDATVRDGESDVASSSPCARRYAHGVARPIRIDRKTGRLLA
jgi:hypothetical protein